MFTPFAFIIDPSFYNPTSRIIPTTSSLFLGGPIYSYQSPPARGIVKIQSNGLIDSTFVTTASFTTTTSGLNGNALKASTQPDGKIIVTYNGTTYTGYNSARLVRINQNGSPDSSFNVGGGFVNNSAFAVKCQSDLKTIFGGNFNAYSGSSSPNIIRVNSSGSRDTTFNAGTGPNSTVYDVDVQSDGKVIAVGDFTTYSGSSNNSIVRINTDGTKDTTFNLGTGITPTNYIGAFYGNTFGSFDNSGSFYLGGGIFFSYSGSIVGKVVKITPSGSIDLSFQTSGSGFNGFDSGVATILSYNI